MRGRTGTGPKQSGLRLRRHKAGPFGGTASLGTGAGEGQGVKAATRSGWLALIKAHGLRDLMDHIEV